MTERFTLPELKGKLDDLALELLKGRFPHVDVAPYYELAEARVNGLMKRDKRYKRDVASDDPAKTLIGLTMDKVASAYTFISGTKDATRINRLLEDFKSMVEDYLEGIGRLTH